MRTSPKDIPNNHVKYSDSCSVAPIDLAHAHNRTKKKSRFSRIKDARHIFFDISECKYDVVRNSALFLGWKLVSDSRRDENATSYANITWIDTPCIGDKFREIMPWQRINHFPGMSSISRKVRMAQSLDRMRKKFPLEYRFYPQTWILPAELSSFKNEFDVFGKSAKTFIIKPDSGCQGKGIFLTQVIDEQITGMDSQVAQLYIKRPLLIDGFKFDLRVYVLIASIRPLRMYIFKDGLARLCTNSYSKPVPSNIQDRCMHLTNYAINKHNGNFVANEDADHDDVGSKRSLRWLLEWIEQSHGKEKASLMWHKIGQCAVKTIVSILPTLHKEYISTFGMDAYDASRGDSSAGDSDQLCFRNPSSSVKWGKLLSGYPPIVGSRCIEILGFDFMIDESLKPWLIEVNHLPSFATDSPLDFNIKSKVIKSALSIIQAKPTDRLSHMLKNKKQAQNRLYSKMTLNVNDKSTNEIENAELKRDLKFSKAQGGILQIQQKHGFNERQKVLIDSDEASAIDTDESEIHQVHEAKETDGCSGLEADMNCHRYSPGVDNENQFSCNSGSKKEASGISDRIEFSLVQLGGVSLGTVESDEKASNSTAQEGELREKLDTENLDGNSKQIEAARIEENVINHELKIESSTKSSKSEMQCTPIWKEETNPSVLEWEAGMLDGWDRLWPPVKCKDNALDGLNKAPASNINDSSCRTNGKAAFDDGKGAGDTTYPMPLHKQHRHTIIDMIKYVFDEHDRQMARLKAPLQQNRGSIDINKKNRNESCYLHVGPGTYTLPDEWKKYSDQGMMSMGRPPPKPERAPIPISGPEQRERSRKLSSGQSVATLRESTMNRSLHPQKLSIACQRAKEWRMRLSEQRIKSYVTIPLKMHSFSAFEEEASK